MESNHSPLVWWLGTLSCYCTLPLHPTIAPLLLHPTIAPLLLHPQLQHPYYCTLLLHPQLHPTIAPLLLHPDTAHIWMLHIIERFDNNINAVHYFRRRQLNRYCTDCSTAPWKRKVLPWACSQTWPKTAPLPRSSSTRRDCSSSSTW